MLSFAQGLQWLFLFCLEFFLWTGKTLGEVCIRNSPQELECLITSLLLHTFLQRTCYVP